MTVIIKNANPENLEKVPNAIKQYNELTGSKKERLTIEWLSGNGCSIYSEGEKDKRTINVK